MVFVCLSLIIGVESHAAINPSFVFQGKAAQIDGTSLPDATYDFSFSIYTQQTGGSAIWSEDLLASTSFAAAVSAVSTNADSITLDYNSDSNESTLKVGQYLTASSGVHALIKDFDTAANTVTVVGTTSAWSVGDTVNNRPRVEGDVIDVPLGTRTSLSGLNFDQPLYLEVVFNGEIMSPRKLLTASPQAFNAERVGNYAASELAKLGLDQTVNASWTFSTSSAQSVLTVLQTGSGNIVEFKNAADSYLTVLNDGTVHIGNYSLAVSDPNSGYSLPKVDGAAGYILKTDGNGQVYWFPDQVGVGGGIQGGWASSTDNSILYPADSQHIVVIGNIATSAPGYRFEVRNGPALFEGTTIGNQGLMKLNEQSVNGTNFVALRATSTLSQNYTFTLPDSYGISGQVLLTDGNGNLYWGGTGAVTVNAGVAGYLPYYSGANTISATSSIFISPATGYVGIGTTTPGARFVVNGETYLRGVSGELSLYISPTGLVNVGTTTGTEALSVQGNLSVSGNIITNGLVDGYDISAIGPYAISSYGTIGQVWTSRGNGQNGQWISTSTLNIAITDTTGILPISRGGTNWNSTAQSGVVVLNNGAWSASTTLSTVYGGTGLSSFTPNYLVYATDANTLGQIATSSLAINLGDTTGTLATNRGGTGLISYAPYQLLYATGANTIAQIATSALDIAIADTVGILAVGKGGFGTSSAGWNGIAIANGGVWGTSTTLPVSMGGTGLSSFNQYSLLFATTTGSIGQIDPGLGGQFLIMNGGRPEWATIASITPVSHNLLSSQHGDTSGTTTYARGDLVVRNATQWDRLSLGGSGFILYSNGTDPAWTSFNNLFDTRLLATTSDALQEGTINRYYTDIRARNAISAAAGPVSYSTTTGVISFASPLSVAFGGLGTTTFQQNSLIYASAANTIGEVTAAMPGNVLQLGPTGIPTWAATNSLGIDFNAILGSLNPNQGGTGRDSSAWTGFVKVTGGVWGTSTINVSSDTIGTLPVNRGGSGATTFATDQFLVYDGSSLTASGFGTSSFASSTHTHNYEDAFLVLGIGKGGTGTTTFATNKYVYFNGTNLTSSIYDEGDFALTSHLHTGTYQPFNNSLAGLSDFATTGIMVYLGGDQYAGRSLSGSAGRLVVTNGDGVAGNIVLDLATTSVTAGNYSHANVTIDQYGRITAASTSTIDLAVEVSGILSVTHGGLGTSTIQQNSILYASGNNQIGEILAGTDGYILQSINGVPTWRSTTTLGIVFGNIGGIVGADQGGFGTSTAGWSGIAIVNGGIWSATTVLPVTMGGTGSTTASGARANLGLVIGNDIQAYNAYLNQIAGLSITSDDFLLSNAGAWTAASTSTVRTALGLDNIFQFAPDTAGTSSYLWMSNGTGRGTWAATGTLGLLGLDTVTDLTANYLTIWDGNRFASSSLYEFSGKIGLGTTTPADKFTVNGDIGALNQGAFKMYELASNGNDAISFIATSSVNGSKVFAWPGAYGNAGEALMSDGSGNLYWDTPTGAGTVGYGETGWLPFYAANGNVLTGTSSIYLTAEGRLAIGTTTVPTDGEYPVRLVVAGGIATDYICDENGNHCVDLSSGDLAKSVFVGTSTWTTDGDFASSTYVGYQAANHVCNAEFAGSHFCRTDEIIYTIYKSGTAGFGGTAWIAEGPPGYTSNSNDCIGWKSATNNNLGAFWLFETAGGGSGWLVNCSVSKPVACCR